MLLAALAALLPAAAGAAAAGERLPDLEQEPPSTITVIPAQTASGAVEYRLGFRSAVRNVGRGPLVVEGSRPDGATPAMRADQRIRCEGCRDRLVRGVGRLRFVTESDHQHWHLLGFERYSLRRLGAPRAAVRDRKSGFCLGDRYRVQGVHLDDRSPQRFRTRCGLHRPDLLRVREGISVGWGDEYGAFLEGQYLPLTGLTAGRYVLVHRVNVTRALRESDYANDVQAVLLRLRVAGGVPTVRFLRYCGTSATCGR